MAATQSDERGLPCQAGEGQAPLPHRPGRPPREVQGAVYHQGDEREEADEPRVPIEDAWLAAGKEVREQRHARQTVLPEGTPRIKLPSVAPKTTAESADANEKIVSQNSRHRGLS